MSAGVLSGLQNQYEGLGASWVGSIPTHSRHATYLKKNSVEMEGEEGCECPFMVLTPGKRLSKKRRIV